MMFGHFSELATSVYSQVYDGSDMTYPELMRFCGAALPVPAVYRSRSNQMYIRMRTDNSISAKGFKADYITGLFTIRIFHGCEVRIEKSVQGSLFGIMRLCQVMPDSDPEGGIFLSTSNNHDRFFFLHTC